jgi:hypothetical protein
MKATTIKILIFSLMLVGVSCADYCSNLQTFVIHVLSQDVKNDKEMYDEILAFANEHSDKFERCAGDLFEEDVLSEEKLFEYINDIAKRKGFSPLAFNAKDGSQKIDPLRFKFYLESSASVWPYDRPGTDGEFKSAIVGLLNRITRATGIDNSMHVVNSQVFPYPVSFEDFIVTNNIFEDVKNIGLIDRTDFRLIFDHIMGGMEDSEVAVLVSDRIYSVPQMVGNTPQSIANSVEGLTQNVFNRYADDIAMLIVKLNGTYHGKYFYFDFEGNRERWFNYQGMRPYYFMFFAKNDVMERFLTFDNYRSIRDFKSLAGYKDFYLFKGDNLYVPYHSILMRHADERARYIPAKVKAQNITQIERVGLDKFKKTFQLVVGVDLSSYFISESYKMNIENYFLSNPSFRVIEVKPIGDYNGQTRGTATHAVVIKTDDINKARGELKLKFVNRLADWIGKSSTMNDSSSELAGFEQATFVFEPMMQGVYKAYHDQLGESNFFEFSLHLK